MIKIELLDIFKILKHILLYFSCKLNVNNITNLN